MGWVKAQARKPGYKMVGQKTKFDNSSFQNGFFVGIIGLANKLQALEFIDEFCNVQANILIKNYLNRSRRTYTRSKGIEVIE